MRRLQRIYNFEIDYVYFRCIKNVFLRHTKDLIQHSQISTFAKRHIEIYNLMYTRLQQMIRYDLVKDSSTTALNLYKLKDTALQLRLFLVSLKQLLVLRI